MRGWTIRSTWGEDEARNLFVHFSHEQIRLIDAQRREILELRLKVQALTILLVQVITETNWNGFAWQ